MDQDNGGHHPALRLDHGERAVQHNQQHTTRDRIRQWAWLVAGLGAALGFFWMGVVLQETLASALFGALFCGLVPLFIAGWILFSPSDSFGSPLRFMGHRAPTIVHSPEPEKAKVVRRPAKAKRRPKLKA